MGNFLSEVKTYSPAEVTCQIGGIPISGYSEDSMVSVAPETDNYTHTSSADGLVVVSVDTDRRATATITLDETSDSNIYMLGQLEAQKLAKGKALKAVFRRPFVLNCPHTGEKIISTHSIILNTPEVGKSKAKGTREWRVLLPYPQYIRA